MFFGGWSALARILVVGVLAYVGLVLFLRVTGKRTLSKLNAFDLVVTVAFGSALATVLLSRDVTLTDGLAAFALLMALQMVATWLSVRSKLVSRALKSQPRMLFQDGRFMRDAMKHERVVEAEILQAVRQSGTASLDEVHAVVLETDGSLSVISGEPGDAERSSLADVTQDPSAST